jgi:hypothetical protein
VFSLFYKGGPSPPTMVSDLGKFESSFVSKKLLKAEKEQACMIFKRPIIILNGRIYHFEVLSGMNS